MTLVQKTLKNQKGLTLIELLAVIVILGIIAAIAVPAIGNIIENSREKAQVSEALNIISAAKIAHASGEGNVDTSTGNITWNNATNPEGGTATNSDLAGYVNADLAWTSVIWTKDTGVYTIVVAANTLPAGVDHNGIDNNYDESDLADYIK